MKLIGPTGAGSLIVELSQSEFDSIQSKAAERSGRPCRICGGPIDPSAHARQSICDKPACYLERNRRWASESYARRTGKPVELTRRDRRGELERPTLPGSCAAASKELDKSARLALIRRADQRLCEAEVNGGRIPNRRDPAERPDPVET